LRTPSQQISPEGPLLPAGGISFKLTYPRRVLYLPWADVLPLASAIEGSPARKLGCAHSSGVARGPPSPRSMESCAVYSAGMPWAFGPTIAHHWHQTVLILLLDAQPLANSRTRATIAKRPSKPIGLTERGRPSGVRRTSGV